MERFEPMGDRILVKPDAEPVKTGGLAVPASQKEEPTRGVVVALGPAAISVVAVGDTVSWTRYAGRRKMHMGTEHVLLRMEEIDGRIIKERE